MKPAKLRGLKLPPNLGRFFQAAIEKEKVWQEIFSESFRKSLKKIITILKNMQKVQAISIRNALYT